MKIEQTLTSLSFQMADMFILLIHFYLQEALTCPVKMKATSRDGKCIDITIATASKHKNIVRQLLAAHTLSECDTVAQLCGIRKSKMMKALQGNHNPSELENIDVALANFIQECAEFIAACYRQIEATSMNDLQYKMWKKKTAKANIVSVLTLMSSTLTTQAFEQNECFTV